MFSVTPRRSIKPSRKRQSVLPHRVGSSRSINSFLQMDESSRYNLETCANPPVQITEVLGSTDKLNEVSVHLSDSGWAWLVCGRRLFVWFYKPSRRQHTQQHCRELLLPPSDLAHKAELVCVYSSPEVKTPACIAVSPAGIVRHWPSIAREGTSIEVSVELRGEECESLTWLQPYGCLLATTTSTIVFLKPETNGGVSNIVPRPFKSQHGILGGISRRVSSMFFGSMSSQYSEAKLVKVTSVPNPDDDEKGHDIYILSGGSLKKWHLGWSGEEKLLYDYEVDKPIQDALSDHFGKYVGDLRGGKSWMLDMEPYGSYGVIISVAVLFQGNIHYALAVIQSENSYVPEGVHSLHVLPYSQPYDEEREYELLSDRLVHTQFGDFMYNPKRITCIAPRQGDSEAREVEHIEFRVRNSRWLGAGILGGIPLFFSTDHGIVSIQVAGDPTLLNLSIMDSTLDQSNLLSESFNVSVSQVDDPVQTKDKIDKLRSAFLLFSKKDTASSRDLILDLAHDVESESGGWDRIVVQLSGFIIDDYPATDPRWAEAVNSRRSIASSVSLIIFQQLKDKQNVYETYISFLKSLKIWEKLDVVNVRGESMYTVHVLSENLEKIMAAIAVHTLIDDYGTLIESALKKIIEKRGEGDTGSLKPQDIYFREVSRMDEFVEALIEVELHSIYLEVPAREMIPVVMNVNKILLEVLGHVMELRNQTQDQFLVGTPSGMVQYLPWTASSGKHGLRTNLQKQFELTINHGVKLAEESSILNHLYRQLMELADFLLDGYRCQMSSLSTDDPRRKNVEKTFISCRQQFIKPLLDGGQYENAASLAEKHEDFSTLVQICDLTHDQQRLEIYTEKYREKGFSELVFDWYIQKQKFSQLLDVKQQDELGKYLEERDLKQLQWLHSINNGDFQKASHTLTDLAADETTYLAKKKTLSSLAFLTSLASDDPIDENRVNMLEREREIVFYQEKLPLSVLESSGLDPKTMPVLSPRQLIDLYISAQENPNADMYDFKRALNLLAFLEPGAEDAEALKLRIWCAAILKNSWDDVNTDDPVESCQETVYYGVIHLLHTEGEDIVTLLPSEEELLSCEELEELATGVDFQFLIKASYEYVRSALCV